MKNLSLFPFVQNSNENSRALFYVQKEGLVPSYLESNDLKLDRFKDIVTSYLPGFNKKSLQFVVDYLKELKEKIRIVLVRSPGGPNRHCMLFGKSQDGLECGKDLYFRVGITPSTDKHPKGRMYVESVESEEKTYFDPDDTRAFDRAMKKFYKEVLPICCKEKKKEIVQLQPEVQPKTTESVEPISERHFFEMQKARTMAGDFLQKSQEWKGQFVEFSQGFLVRVKEKINEYKKII